MRKRERERAAGRRVFSENISPALAEQRNTGHKSLYLAKYLLNTQNQRTGDQTKRE